MPRTRPTRRAAAHLLLGAALLFGTFACSDDKDTKTYKDKDGNEISVSDDGEKVSVSTPDGEVEASSGSSAKLPEGWPAKLALPDGAVVQSGMSLDGGKQKTVIALVEDGDVADLQKTFKSIFEDAGYEIDSDNMVDTGDGAMASVSGSAEGEEVAVSITNGDEGTTVAISVRTD